MPRDVLIEFRRDTAANWTSGNPTLADGEPGWEKNTGKVKIGDGSTAWNSLPYIGASAGVTSFNSRTGAVLPVSGDYAGILAAFLTGATQASRYAGATASGAPVSGTFATGDFIIARDGHIYICTAGGTPGTWIDAGAYGGPPSGSAGGVLSGTYPNPGMAAGAAVANIGAAGLPIADIADPGAGKVIGSSSGAAAVFPPGYQFDYVEITAAVTVTSTADGTSGGTSIIAGSAVSYDGSTRVKVEFYAPYGSYNLSGQNLVVNLYEGTTDLGRLCNLGTPASAQDLAPLKGERFLTPSNASHTYTIRAWKTNAGGSASVGAGAGGSSAYMPAFLRITKA